jgi:hypothetical protein
VNLGDIRSRILDGLNDPDSIFWTTAELNEIIQDGMEVMAEHSQAVKRTAFVPFRDGATYYSLRGVADDVMSIYRLWDESHSQILTPVTQMELDEHNERWPDATGRPERWFSVSWDLFGIYPKPANGGGILRVDYNAWPRDLADDSDEPEYSLGDHDSIVDYGIYEGLLKRWDFKRAVEAFSPFAKKVLGVKARTGVERLESKDSHRRAF